MRPIIFEGPDGAGKSYIAEFISKKTGIPVYHAGGPPRDKNELLERIDNMLKMDHIIFDRFPLISDQIYGPILRNRVYLTFSQLGAIKFPVIYCRPSDETLAQADHKIKAHKEKSHVDGVKSKHTEIVSAYDEIMEYITHIKFNRDTHSCTELLNLLDRTIWEGRPCAE